MNKKVLTLCAGFLLAGGMLSSLSAEKISAVADDGKYYLMKRVAEVSTVGESAAWNVMNNGYFISLNGDVAGLVSRTAEAKDYWKVISFKKSDGKTYYQLVNLEGSYFYVSQKDGENTLFHFDFTEGETTEVADGEVTFSQLFINDDYNLTILLMNLVDCILECSYRIICIADCNAELLHSKPYLIPEA